MRRRIVASSSRLATSWSRLATLVLLLVLGTTRLAHADDDDQRDRLSPGTATALSAGITAGGAAAFIGGLVAPRSDLASAGVIGGGTLLLLGPSTGHWYAGELRPTTAAALRVSGAGLALATVVMAGTVCAASALLDDDPTHDHACSLHESPWAMTALIISAGMYLGGAAYDIRTARRAVLRENARRAAAARRPSWAVAPLVSPTATGVSMVGSF